MSAVLKTRVLQPGDVVRVCRCHGAYPLPEGLLEGTVVTVNQAAYGYANVTDNAGKEWRIAFSNIDMPCSIWWSGEWIDRMTHPDGEHAFQWALQSDAEM